MNPLESRKKLLIAESELNRAQLVYEWHTVVGEARTLTRQARTISSLASAAASLVTGLLAFRHKKPEPADAKSSWLKTILKGAGMISTLWQSSRLPGREPADK